LKKGIIGGILDELFALWIAVLIGSTLLMLPFIFFGRFDQPGPADVNKDSMFEKSKIKVREIYYRVVNTFNR
jgi:phosphatidylglycerophosphatase A